jgi:hypothetical protein
VTENRPAPRKSNRRGESSWRRRLTFLFLAAVHVHLAGVARAQTITEFALVQPDEEPRPSVDAVPRDRRPRVVVFRSGPRTSQTVNGTTRAVTPTSCSSDSHDFSAGEGPVSVTLLQSTDNLTLGVQVCAGGIDNNDCTINLQRIALNQTVTGYRKGGRNQNLKFLPPNCGGGGPAPPGPVQYTAIVSYPN